MQKLLVALFFTVAPWAVSCKEEAGKPPPAPPPTAAATTAPTATGATTVAAVTTTTTAAPTATAAVAEAPLALPPQLAGKAVLVPKGDPDEKRADLASAIKAAGEGGITQGIVVRLTTDIPIWRMWSGPTKKDASGHTNRMGQWWSYDPPHDTQTAYRAAYEICNAWNELTWVAKCTLKKGAVVAIGPGQSVSPKTCGDPSGKEAYPVDSRDWQVWISKIWERSQEVDCPPDAKDYEADLADISHVKKAAAHPPGK
jgi:hypothetical protein